MDILHRISVDLISRCSGNTFCHYAKGFQRGFASILVTQHLAPKTIEELVCRPLLGPVARPFHTRPFNLKSRGDILFRKSCVPPTSCTRLCHSQIEQLKYNNSSLVLPQEIIKLLEDLPQDISKALFCDESKEVNQLSEYYFQLGGKRMRPSIVFLMAAALNPNKFPVVDSKQYRIGVICEMIHTASLVHDDVIDEADSRRNKISLNQQFGNKKAILIGDYILAKATQLLCTIGDSDVIALLAQVIEDLVKGEFMQMDSKNSMEKRYLHYMQKTFKKTASLFAHSCKAVAVLDNCSSNIATISFEYGKHIGIAFQLVDDILDFVAQSSLLGKPAAADLKLGIATAPVLFASQQYPELEPLIKRRFSQSGDVQTAWKIVLESDGIRKARSLAQEHVEKAVACAETLQPSKYRDALQEIAHVQIHRQM